MFKTKCAAYWNGIRCELYSAHAGPHIAESEKGMFGWGGENFPVELWGKTFVEISEERN